MTYQGEMGKGGKSPVETKDSLVSDQIAKVLFVVGEGLIDSIENVYLDTTEITAFDAEYDWRDGSGSQSVIGFSDGDGFIANESSLPGFASKLIDHGAGTVETFDDAIDHIETIPYEADCKSVRLTFSIPVMSYLDPDGNLVGSQVEIGIYTRPSSSGLWTLFANPVKNGKTTNGYAFDIIVPRPTTTTAWQINVKRKTKDSTSTKRQNKINLSMITQIYQDLSLTYNNSALIGIKIKDPTQFGNRIPEIMFRLRGKKVKIPSNYNSVTRVYTGVWDGTFNTLTKYYTNNPAWILLDVLTDTRSGLGIDIADIDKYAIYNLAKYCDETISDGFGGTIPRYTLDYQFQERQGVSQFLAQILSICNANIITNEFGQISVVYIYPNQVIKRNVTNANVVDGSFTYQSSGLEARTTLANVTYNNGLNFGRTDTATVSDDGLITRYGLQVIDVVLPGCYHEAQAIRKARYTLFSNCYFVNFVSFSVFLDGLTYKIGDLIRIFDNYNQNETQGGLAASVVNAGGNTTITFDRPCALDAGSYTFYIYDTDGTVHTKSVTGGSTISSVVFNSTITIATGAPFVFSGPAAGKIYRVTDIQKSEDSLYAVTALEWSESIFDYINGSITIVPKSGDYANLNDLSTSPVINLNIAQNFGSNGTYRTSNLIVSWLWDVANAQKYQAKFKLAYSKDGGQQHIVENINTDTYAIPNPFPGVYEITVWAVNPVTGFLSTPVNTTYNFRTSVAASTLQPPVNLVVAGTAGTTFSTRDVTIAWESNPDNALATVEDVLHDYVVELYDQTATLYGTYSVPRQNAVSTVDPYDSTTTYWQLPGSLTLPFADNYAYFGTAKRQLTFAVYARDTMGDLSDPAWVTVNNPAPTFTSLTVDTGISAVNVTIGVSSEPDVKDYLVYRGSSSGFTPSAGNLVYRGANNQINIKTPDNNVYYYKAAISDSFGEDSLNYSGAVSGSSISIETALTCVLSNDTWTFPCDSSGVPSTYTGSGTDIYVYEGSTAYACVASITANNQFTITAVGAGITPGAVTVGVAKGTVGVASAITTNPATVTYTITVRNSKGQTVVLTKVQSFSKSISGVNGAIGPTVNITANNPSVFTATDGTLDATAGTVNPTITFTANTTGMTGQTYSWTQSIDGATATSISTASTATLSAATFGTAKKVLITVTVTYNAVTYKDVISIVRLEKSTAAANATRNVFQGNWTSGTAYAVGDIVLDASGYGWSCLTANTASATIKPPTYPTTSNTYWTLYTVKGADGTVGANALTCILSNESWAFPCDSAGTPSTYAGSGTDIYVYEGTTAYNCVATITANNQFTISATGTGITAGSVTVGTGKGTLGAASAITTNPATITITITARTSTGSTITVSKLQSFSKSIAGATGATGATGTAGAIGAQGAMGPTVNITTNNPAVFTSTDGTLDTSSGTINPTITFTANTTGMTGQTYAWTQSIDGGTATSISTTSTATLSAATFGTAKKVLIKITVTYNGSSYTDTIDVLRLEKSTAAAGATVGAIAGTNLKDSSGNILADSSIKNSAITIANNGSLSGAGGGQVTIGGLGYTGDLNATVGAIAGTNLKDSYGTVLADSAVKNSAVTIASDGTLSGAGGGKVTIGGLGYSGDLAATKNTIYRQTTAPTGGTYTTGDLWVDTDSNPTTIAQWTGTAWGIVSTYVNNTSQISDGANLGGTATWNGVTGTGKAADNATVNNVTYSPSAPASPTNGDIWVDTSTTPYTAKVRVSSAWQIASNLTTNTNQLTDGAGLGTTALWSGVTGAGKPADGATANASLSGSGAPSAALGNSGDSYWDYTNNVFYYKYPTYGWKTVFIDSNNISTYLNTGVIGNAYIGSLNANKIINNTLVKFLSAYAATGNAVASSTSIYGLQSNAAVTKTFTHRDYGANLILMLSGSFDSGTTSVRRVGVLLSGNAYYWDSVLNRYVAGAYFTTYASTVGSNSRYQVVVCNIPSIYLNPISFNASVYQGSYLVHTGDVTATLYLTQASGVTVTPTEVSLSFGDIYA